MRAIILILCIGFSSTVYGQTKQDYIYTYAEIAVQEMEKFKIPASIKLAQGILESRFGQSELAATSNNHFGIKCHDGWSGLRTYHNDDARNECFRVYSHPEESFRDHSEFLTSRGRYSQLFRLKVTDYKGWANGLRKAGYATNPQYAQKLIRIIEEEKLYVFDRMKSKNVAKYVANLRGDNGFQNTIPVGGPAGSLETYSTSIFSHNNLKVVHFQPYDSPSTISSRTGVSIKRLLKYNEWNEHYVEMEPGDFVFLQPKRNKSRNRKQTVHTVALGESMYQIAQQYGIKTEKLYQLNNLTPPQQPHPGELISLRKKRDTSPKLLNKNELQAEQSAPMEPTINKVEVERVQKAEEAVVDIDNEVEPVVDNSIPVVVKDIERVEVSEPVFTPNPVEEAEEIISTDTTNPFGEGKNIEKNADEEVYEGRAIIYEPTPEVNQQPVEVYTPPAPKPVSEGNPAPVIIEEYHTVVKGDTLYALSKKYGVTVNQLKEWNGLTDNNIKIGQKLVVKK